MSPGGGGRREAREAGVGVVAEPAVAVGFELAALAVAHAGDPSAAREAARELASDPDVGVILIQEELVDDLLELEADLRGVGGAVLVPFPGPVWTERPGAAREHVARILRRAIGYQVRL